MQMVKSKLNKLLKGETPTQIDTSVTGYRTSASNVKVEFGRDRGRGINITKNINYRF